MRALIIAGFAVALAACNGQVCEVPSGETPVFVARVGCDADFVTMSTDRDDAVFAHTLAINVIVDREDNDAVYYIDPDFYLLHWRFAMTYLNDPDKTPVGDLGAFNLLNYRRDNRRFILAQEIYPRTRTSNAVALNGRYFLPYRAAVYGGYRFFTATTQPCLLSRRWSLTA